MSSTEEENKEDGFLLICHREEKTLYNYLKKYCSSVGSSGILFVICAVFPKQMGLVCMYFFISIYVQILWCSSSLRLFVCMFQWFLHTGFLVSAVMMVVERGPEVKYVFFCVCMYVHTSHVVWWWSVWSWRLNFFLPGEILPTDLISYLSRIYICIFYHTVIFH